MSEDAVERLSRRLHSIYQEEARRQLPEAELRHPDDYDALPEPVKEFDRVLARFILEREQDLQTQVASLRSAGKEFLDASEAAAKPMHSSKLEEASARWIRAGARLRTLIGGAVLVGSRN